MVALSDHSHPYVDLPNVGMRGLVVFDTYKASWCGIVAFLCERKKSLPRQVDFFPSACSSLFCVTGYKEGDPVSCGINLPHCGLYTNVGKELGCTAVSRILPTRQVLQSEI